MDTKREAPPARVKWPSKLPLICRTMPGSHGGPRHSGTSERAGPADDLVILVKTRRAGERVMQSIARYLETTLKLKVNPAKSKVAPMGECAFLGFTIKGKKIRWTEKSEAAFKHRVKELTGRTPAMQQALSNAWLKAQRLVSVKDLWSKAHGCTVQERGKLRRASRLGCSAHCGPARWVVWGLGDRNPRSPD